MRRRSLPLLALLAPLLLASCGDDDGPSLTPKQQELVRATEACLRRAGCLGRDEANLPECIASFTTKASWYGREELLDCTHAAGASCDALLACLNAGEPAETCETPYPYTCENANPPVFHDCQDGREIAAVCTTGTTCAVSGIPHQPCGIASCNQAMTPPMCDPDTGRRLTCQQAVLVPEPCAEGLVCVDGACVGPGDPCNALGGMRCDGTVLTYCANQRRATRDCAATGHICGTVSGEAACTGNACSGRGLSASCSGTTLTLCHDGVAYTFACGRDGLRCCGAG